MKLIIDIYKDTYKNVMKKDTSFDEYSTGSILSKIIQNGTPILDNATNGDMIKVLFPNCDCLEFIHDINVYPDKTRQKVVGNFDRDWWNAPYKSESEDKE